MSRSQRAARLAPARPASHSHPPRDLGKELCLSAWRGAIKTRAKQKKKIRLPANHAAGRRACSRQSNRMRPLAGTLAGQVAATALHAPSTYIHVPRASAAPPPPSLAVAALPDGRRRRRGGCATRQHGQHGQRQPGGRCCTAPAGCRTGAPALQRAPRLARACMRERHSARRPRPACPCTSLSP